MNRMRPNILIADAQQPVRASLSERLKTDGYYVETATTTEEVVARLTDEQWDVFLIDSGMLKTGEHELQKKIKEICPGGIIIVLTERALLSSAKSAVEHGAFYYLTKPLDEQHVGYLVRNALASEGLTSENVKLKDSIDLLIDGNHIIGASADMKKVVEAIENASQTDTPVLISGESGTGKEFVASAIHAGSRRRYMPLVILDCRSLHNSALEARLFGYEKGAFNGAHDRYQGKAEKADGGTLVVDEIDGLGPEVQAKLLGVIERKKTKRIGGDREIDVNIRLIATTSKDLAAECKAGSFSEGLCNHLKSFAIRIPPLRERRFDVPLLVEHFLQKHARLSRYRVTAISSKAMEEMIDYSWPGNVSELENAIERAMIVCRSDRIRPEHLPISPDQLQHGLVGKTLEDVEREHIRSMLDETGWNISRAARLLEIDRVTLYRKIKKFELSNLQK